MIPTFARRVVFALRMTPDKIIVIMSMVTKGQRPAFQPRGKSHSARLHH